MAQPGMDSTVVILIRSIREIRAIRGPPLRNHPGLASETWPIAWSRVCQLWVALSRAGYLRSSARFDVRNRRYVRLILLAQEANLPLDQFSGHCRDRIPRGTRYCPPKSGRHADTRDTHGNAARRTNFLAPSNRRCARALVMPDMTPLLHPFIPREVAA